MSDTILGRMARDVSRFNDTVVGLPIPEKPTLISRERADHAIDCFQEEIQEFDKAVNDGDLGEAIDACIDLAYFALGRVVEMGAALNPHWDIVQHANMLRQRGQKASRPRSLGWDAIKPPGWQAPDHEAYLSVTKEELEWLKRIRDLLSPFGAKITDAKLERVESTSFMGLPMGGRMEVISPRRLMGGDFADLERRVMASAAEFLDPGERVTGMSPLMAMGYVGSPRRKGDPYDFLAKYGAGPRVGEVFSKIIGVEAEAKPKVMVMGYARHGKDTVAELLTHNYGLSFSSSSHFCAEHIVFPALKEKYGYSTWEQCYDDRASHRAEWYDLITAFNTPDLSRLGRSIFAEKDIYCGIRNAREFHACKNAGLFDFAVWVDASERVKETEDRSSCTVEPWMADYVVDNNGNREQLWKSLQLLMSEGLDFDLTLAKAA